MTQPAVKRRWQRGYRRREPEICVAIATVNELNLELAGFYRAFRRARACGEPELYEEAPQKQNAQDDENRDDDDLD